MTRWLAGSLALVLCWTGSAWAQVPPAPGPLQAVPNGLNVSVLRPTALNVKWVISGATPGVTGTSTSGHFVSGNPTVGTFTGAGAAAGNISQNCLSTNTANTRNIGTNSSTVAMVIAANGVGRAVENLIISSTVTQKALAQRVETFFYCRNFSNIIVGGTPAAATVTCKQGSSAYAAFSIGRVELYFENRRREITVRTGTPNLKVLADVAYNGSGLLRAVWEVAEAQFSGAETGTVSAPPSRFTGQSDQNLSASAGNFRTLAVINQFVSYGDRVLLTLPGGVPLPTTAPGAYDVNLRFVEPPVPFAIPVARYFVQSGDHPLRISLIGTQMPLDNAVLAPRPFDFRWDGAPGVSVYRLDVYPQEVPSGPSLPGLIQSPATSPTSDSNVFNRGPREGAGARGVVSVEIPAQVTSFTLRPSQLAKLVPGGSYAWRIRGLDQKSNIVAESPMRQFTLQAR
ncbi:MAG: hypothetical protein HY616_09980 [Candidatus Rokubacteria bacterium]|nr:hypothetical protein [Candidatus Rokubacteria bacterium]